MSRATATTWIRTESGAVQIDAGERAPQDALPGEIDRLTAAGLLSPDPVEKTEDDEAPKPRRTRKAAESKES